MTENWYQVTVQDELAKNKQLTMDMINEMRDWLHQLPYYPPIPDMELVLFLQACDFEIDAAKKTLENNYTMRTKSILFKERSVDKEAILKSRESVELFVLSGTDDDGAIVGGGKLFDPDISRFHPQGLFEEAIMILEVYQLEMGTTSGLEIIIDVQGATLRHIIKVPLALMKAVFHFAQEAITLKIKSLHFINTRGSIIDTIIAFLRPFLKDSLFQKIHIHPGHETLTNFINSKILPEEYGGQGGKLKSIARETQEKLLTYKKYFTLDEVRRIDESKRPKEKSKYFGWF